MSLSNLQAIGRLQAQAPDPASIVKLLQAAHQNLADARVQQISATNRFDAAYKCIMQCAMLGLWANGWRTWTRLTPPNIAAVPNKAPSVFWPSAKKPARNCRACPVWCSTTRMRCISSPALTFLCSARWSHPPVFRPAQHICKS